MFKHMKFGHKPSRNQAFPLRAQSHCINLDEEGNFKKVANLIFWELIEVLSASGHGAASVLAALLKRFIFRG